MTEQPQEPTADQNLTTQEHLERLTSQYVRFAVEQSFSVRGGNLEQFDEFWALISPGIELGQDHSVSIGGKPAGDYIQAFKASPDLRAKFFDAESSQTQPGSSHQNQATSPKTQVPECLYVSRQQLMSREFMLQAGPELSRAIQNDLVKIDDSRAVQNGYEIREFLSPKAVEPAAQNQKSEAKSAPKTKEISKAQLLDRSFLRRVDSEWSSEGGYLKNVALGNIKVV